MAPFYPIYIRRSDGKLAVTAHSRKEANEPTAEQLDQKPDKNGISDYYRQVQPDEPKHLDWRRKIGGMLARELRYKDKNADSGYILATFPENYRLYEHVKRKEVDGKLEIKSKTHAAGGNDRQDAYLYGHPQGRKKRYRSPADFFAHVLWLATDESGDPDNCSCKICSPEDLESLGIKPKPVEAPKAAQQPVSRPTSTQPPKPAVKQESSITHRPQAQVQIPQPQSQRPTPTPLPPKQSEDQYIDSQYNAFMYRPGELVWFQRGSVSWGLGAILRRWYNPPGSSSKHYSIQPLTYPPFDYPPRYPRKVTQSDEAAIRPWLAWSVPKFTHDSINQLAHPPTYENADWRGLLEKRYGPGDPEVDGSILAAKMVDASYTLISPISPSTQPPGLYLGCEKVWLGDPLRLHQGSGTDILVLHAILPSSNPSQPPTLQGDIYTLLTTKHSDPSLPTPASLHANPQLPTRLTSDLAFRNARSIPARHIASYWSLRHPRATVPLSGIKGRWYEASRILPNVLDASKWEEAQRKGEIGEASLWMNGRGDCVNSNRTEGMPVLPRVDVLRATRGEAFGRSLPEGVRFWEGVKVPSEGEERGANPEGDVGIDPRFDTAEGPGGGSGFEELMDLDGGAGAGDHAPANSGSGNGSGGGGGGYY
ncbi:unnamed protein product [Zymoseptoria tritici ST99CH_1A5]|uniref:Cryptic loci regulator 2 N-terminal domain-containing protein n=1 Tax=Zymoseptoria tritici ST99CH_1A5 TaxID=1276529 RepID=A0A1Y6LXU1_ZYMTR|nr:unnamed protein product [Zymoseptoria tritici ST99CH_1A5]